MTTLGGARALLVSALCLSCSGGPAGLADRQPCETSSECQGGWTCAAHECAKLCNSSVDCPSGDQACVTGVCNPVANPACHGDGDCSSPGLCQKDGTTAICIAGECVAPARVCDSPPANQCTADDSGFISYPADGVCDDAAGCVYAPTQFPCSGCRANCLSVCAGFACDDFNDGCRANGVCVPTNPAGCSYTNAPDGTPCTLADPVGGSTDGKCVAGDCVRCGGPQDCTTPPGDPACFSADCINSVCTYTADVTLRCAVAGCRDGITYVDTLCASDGSCPTTGQTNCNGYACDATGTACGVGPCTDDTDCDRRHYCDPTGACIAKLDDGADCTSGGNTACAAGYCDGSLCCAAGDCCNSAGDCPASYSSTALCTDTSATTDCQGTRTDATCVDHICGSMVVDDDSACDGLAHACSDGFAAQVCSAAPDQPAPACPTSCSDASDCQPLYACTGGVCVCSGAGLPETVCDDGVDNNCNGATDCDDSDCDALGCGPGGAVCGSGACVCPGGEANETTCDDDNDNDCDGLSDCDDPDCDAQTCAADSCGGWGSCNYSGTCDNSGSKSHRCDRHTCVAGVCSVSSSYNESTGCSRNTNSTVCGQTGQCGACSYSTTCTNSGSRTCQDEVCMSGSCGWSSYPNNSACARNTDGAPCGGGRVCCGGGCNCL